MHRSKRLLCSINCSSAVPGSCVVVEQQRRPISISQDGKRICNFDKTRTDFDMDLVFLVRAPSSSGEAKDEEEMRRCHMAAEYSSSLFASPRKVEPLVERYVPGQMKLLHPKIEQSKQILDQLPKQRC